jgi:hypothetical protein
MVGDIEQRTTSNTDPARARNAPKKSIAANFLVCLAIARKKCRKYALFPFTMDLSEWHKKQNRPSG